MTFNVLTSPCGRRCPEGQMRGQSQNLKEKKILKQVQDDMLATSP